MASYSVNGETKGKVSITFYEAEYTITYDKGTEKEKIEKVIKTNFRIRCEEEGKNTEAVLKGLVPMNNYDHVPRIIGGNAAAYQEHYVGTACARTDNGNCFYNACVEDNGYPIYWLQVDFDTKNDTVKQLIGKAPIPAEKIIKIDTF